MQSRQLGCPEAALSRYQLPAVSAVADSQGLDDPVAADGFRQFRQRSGSEFPSGLVGVGSVCSTGSQRTCVSNMRGTS